MAKDNTYILNFTLSNGQVISAGQFVAPGGADTLVYKNVYREEYEGNITDEPIPLPLSGFTRTPQTGESFVLIFEVEESGTVYLSYATVQSVAADSATVSVLVNTIVKITGPKGEAGTTEYDELNDVPIINQDLTANGFSPVSNTYYRHTGTGGTVNSTPLAVGDYVENIYFNTSVDVISLFEGIQDTSENVIAFTDTSDTILVKYVDGVAIVARTVNEEPITIYYASTDVLGLGWSGWNPEFSGSDIYNATISEIVASNNAYLSFISKTPFVSTYTKGVIYYYDGTGYKEIIGSTAEIEKVSDVKVDGTSVLNEEGVANIPPASSTVSGVITPTTQTFKGNKSFSDMVLIGYPNHAQLSFKNGLQITSQSVAYQAIHIGEYNTLGCTDINRQGLKFAKNAVYPIYIQIQPYGSTSSIYITVPDDYTGTMMVAEPWKSGTSGSIALTKSGTYQFYYNYLDKAIYNFGLVYVPLNIEVYSTIWTSGGYGYEIAVENDVVELYEITPDVRTPLAEIIYYRRIGI